jgi:endonuclease YncB( thermonuclease family)
MRLARTLFLLLLLCLAGGAALADDKVEYSGTPAVLPSGLIMIEGHDLALWGIDPLANDQKCWHDERAWDCGEEALTVLRHFLTGNKARCVVKTEQSAQCFRIKDGKEDDIAHYLVGQGLARDRAADSDGLYAPDETEARQNRRGVWTSRFQSAEDWKNGTSHYIQYQMAPPKTPAPTGADKPQE